MKTVSVAFTTLMYTSLITEFELGDFTAPLET